MTYNYSKYNFHLGEHTMFKTHRTYQLTTGVKNNTIAVAEAGRATLVVYHNTIVVLATKTRVHIRNGGWDTVSTRIVINRALEQIPGFRCFHLAKHKGATWLFWKGAPQATFSGDLTLKPETYAARERA